MKKILLGTSALLVAGMISGAAIANPVTLSAGGYANWYVGLVDFNSTYSDANIGVYNNAVISGEVELNFSGETVLQNGLRFGAMMSVVTMDNTNPRIQGSYVFMDSAFGRVMVGEHQSVARQFHTGAKDVGMLGLNASRVANFMPFFDMGIATDVRTMDYNPGISFISPRFEGFSVALSYVQDRFADSNTNGNSASGSITVAYSNVFNNVSLDFDASFVIHDAVAFAVAPIGGGEAMIENEFSIGARVGFEGFTVGGAFRMMNGRDTELSRGPDNNVEGMVFNVGVSFEQGPFGVSLAYVYSQFDHKDGSASEPRVRTDLIMLSGSYAIAPGIDTFASFAFSTHKPTRVADTIRGYGLITGLGLSF